MMNHYSRMMKFLNDARDPSGFFQARSSVGERFLDTEEVGSSILPVPTIFLIV